MPFGLVFGAVVFSVLCLWFGVAALFGESMPGRLVGLVLIVFGCSLSLGAQVGFLAHQIPILSASLDQATAAFGVSITAVALALVIRIKRSYGTIEESEILALDEADARGDA